MVTMHCPIPVPTPVPLFSHPPPAHALMKLPLAAVAASVTLVDVGKELVQPAPPAPAVMVQEMPDGVDLTVPLPPAPPCTAKGNELGGGANLAPMVRAVFIVTLQVKGSSVTAGSHPVQATVPPLAGGEARISTTMPVLKSLAQVPDRVTASFGLTATVQLRPPRFEINVPGAGGTLQILTRFHGLIPAAVQGDCHGGGKEGNGSDGTSGPTRRHRCPARPTESE
jgi:hypothetical protein